MIGYNIQTVVSAQEWMRIIFITFLNKLSGRHPDHWTYLHVSSWTLKPGLWDWSGLLGVSRCAYRLQSSQNHFHHYRDRKRQKLRSNAVDSFVVCVGIISHVWCLRGQEFKNCVTVYKARHIFNLCSVYFDPKKDFFFRVFYIQISVKEKKRTFRGFHRSCMSIHG